MARTLRERESNILLIARGTMPGSSELPMMVCVLPESTLLHILFHCRNAGKCFGSAMDLRAGRGRAARVSQVRARQRNRLVFLRWFNITREWGQDGGVPEPVGPYAKMQP
jgi:hypothetical protein